MKIELRRLNDAFHMEAVNEQGCRTYMDASPEMGGSNLAMRPMQLMLTSLGGCASIDIIDILRKQRQPLQDLRISIDGERQKDVVPALFEKINIHFTLVGNLDEEKVKRAIDLSMSTYCSVAKTLEKTATITYSYSIDRGEVQVQKIFDEE